MHTDPAVGVGTASLGIFDSAAWHALAGVGDTSLARRANMAAPALDAFMSGALASLAGPGRNPLRQLNTGYTPNAYPWAQAPMLINGGESAPRLNFENEAFNPRTWPSIFPVRAMGLAPQVRYIRGPAPFVFNNQLSGGAVGYRTMMPGLAKSPYGSLK